jgi:hypothetical protein
VARTGPQAEAEVEIENDPEESQVTRPSDLGFPSNTQTGPIPKHREIEVEPIDAAPPQIDPSGMVEIRMAETIEEFTYGNPHYNYLLEAGKRYRVPVDIARYLHSLGYIYTR